MYCFLESAGCNALARLYWAGGCCTGTAVTLCGLTCHSRPAVLGTRCSRTLRRDFHISIGSFATLCNIQTCRNIHRQRFHALRFRAGYPRHPNATSPSGKEKQEPSLETCGRTGETCQRLVQQRALLEVYKHCAPPSSARSYLTDLHNSLYHYILFDKRRGSSLA